MRVVCKRRGEDKEVRSNQIMKAFSSFVLNMYMCHRNTDTTNSADGKSVENFQMEKNWEI